MKPKIKQIIIENFKSYKDVTKITTFNSLTAIMGPNGSGKSNLSDAIAFAMGVNIGKLRVNNIQELFYGFVSRDDHRKRKRCSVTLVLELENKEIKTYKRSIGGSRCIYEVDEEDCTEDEYIESLNQLGISSTTENFIVYQGNMEELSVQNPKERTHMFEQLSKSGELKKEYNRLFKEVQSKRENLKKIHELKVECISACNTAKAETKRSREYEELRSALNKKILEQTLFQLYHNDLKLSEASCNLELYKENETVIEKAKTKLKKQLRQLNEDLKKGKDTEGSQKQQLRKSLRNTQKELFEIEAKRAHSSKSLKYAKKNLEKCIKSHSEQQETIKKLKEELIKVEQAKADYLTELSQEYQSQGIDIELKGEQVKEYNRLKQEVQRHTKEQQQQLDILERDMGLKQNQIDIQCKQMAHIENEITLKKNYKIQLLQRLEKLQSAMQSNENETSEKENELETMEEHERQMFDPETIQKQLEEAEEMIQKYELDAYEQKKDESKTRILNDLKNYSEDVVDTLMNLVQPVHNKFNIALIKTLGAYADAIVVQTGSAAKSCIQYLKRHNYGRITFLPLDRIDAKPNSDKLRHIKDPKNVVLLYDVLKFDERYVSAVLLATRNMIVCETVADARHVAFELQSGRNDAVALDGTMFRKSGIISGGTASLLKKAKKLDKKELEKWTKIKAESLAKLKETYEMRCKAARVQTLRERINHLKRMSNYIQRDITDTERRIADVDTELNNLNTQLSECKDKIMPIEEAIKLQKLEVKEILNDQNRLADQIFADFCATIRVKNIRQFESTYLTTHLEREERLLKFENQIDKIKTLLEVERGKDTEEQVNLWKKAVKKLKKQAGTYKTEFEEKERAVNELLQLEKEFVEEEKQERKKLEKIQEEIEKTADELKKLNNEAKTMLTCTVRGNTIVGQLKEERHQILQNCTAKGIELPVLEGRLEDIFSPDSQGQSSGARSSEEIQYEKESLVKFNYNSLPRRLTHLDRSSDLESIDCELEQSITELVDKLEQIHPPRKKKQNNVEKCKKKYKELINDEKKLNAEYKNVHAEFDRVKNERLERFNRFFQRVFERVQEIYSNLSKNPSARAMLIPENEEEPYLAGIGYNCMVGGKSFQTSLSGGENTIASLALLLALNFGQNAPFLIFDEIDAPLDNTNVKKVVRFFKDNENIQVIFVSHNDIFCAHCGILIGVSPKVESQTLESEISFINLDEYPN